MDELRARQSLASDVRMNDLFTIGIGPSSSHTVGPMRAAGAFVDELQACGAVLNTDRIHIALRGSLAATGEGHGTPGAVVAGLQGHAPATCHPVVVRTAWGEVKAGGTIAIAGRRVRLDSIEFLPREPHPLHPNAVEFAAFTRAGRELLRRTYLSVGGGFIETIGGQRNPGSSEAPALPHTFGSFDDLQAVCAQAGGSIAEVMAANETAAGREPRADAMAIWTAMDNCMRAGRLPGPDTLPGGLQVRRRAPGLADRLSCRVDFAAAVARIQVDAMAVNEENALGNRVVTAPTNGAAGILPAVIAHYLREAGAEDFDGITTMLLTAAALGAVIKTNASISGAQVGCQGEVGSACAMAAGALCAALGGTVAQIGKAAEMGLEHHLGLTCDPVGGLVQVPCIERNAIAAVTAVQAATLTLNEGHHGHLVSFDTVVETMRRVGADMHDKYKETSRGGLAVSVVEC